MGARYGVVAERVYRKPSDSFVNERLHPVKAHRHNTQTPVYSPHYAEASHVRVRVTIVLTYCRTGLSTPTVKLITKTLGTMAALCRQLELPRGVAGASCCRAEGWEEISPEGNRALDVTVWNGQ